VRLPTLAESLPRRWSAGSRRQPQIVGALMDELLAGGARSWTLLDWLHVLRHKARWDVTHPAEADRTAELIWQAAAVDVALRGQVLARLVDGLCGGEGLCGSMTAACSRLRPLDSTDPLLQDIIAALSVVSVEPERVIVLCMEHNRAPRELMARVGLPTDLALLDHVDVAIARVMQQHAQDPHRARQAAQWLLMALREATPQTSDRIAGGLLNELSAQEAAALPDLCWWLGETYGPQAARTRWAKLSPGAQASLGAWLG
jgi:hypothetical protein